MLGIDLVKQARECGISLINQEEYERRVEQSQSALRRLPTIKGKLKKEQSRFARLPFVKSLNNHQKKLDALDRKRHKDKEDWREITFLKEEISRIRRSKPFREGLVRINGLKREIDRCYKNMKLVDERRALIDKKPNASRILHDLKRKIRSGMNGGKCDKVRKEKRLLDFYREGDVRFSVSL